MTILGYIFVKKKYPRKQYLFKIFISQSIYKTILSTFHKKYMGMVLIGMSNIMCQ